MDLTIDRSWIQFKIFRILKSALTLETFYSGLNLFADFPLIFRGFFLTQILQHLYVSVCIVQCTPGKVHTIQTNYQFNQVLYQHPTPPRGGGYTFKSGGGSTFPPPHRVKVNPRAYNRDIGRKEGKVGREMEEKEGRYEKIEREWKDGMN